MTRQRNTISFRVNDEIAKQLDAAREPFGLSRHEWARGVLIAWLEKSEEAELNAELIEIRERLEQLETGFEQRLSRLLFGMLTFGLNVSPSDAREAVKQLFPEA